MTLVSVEAQRILLATLSDRPPITVLYSGSLDQRAELMRLKERSIRLRDKLAAYFSGKGDTGGNKPGFDDESLEIEKDKILALYALVQANWGDILKTAKDENGVDFKELDQPGTWVAMLLTAEDADQVDRILSPYYRWTPSQYRKKLKRYREAQELANKSERAKLTAPEKRKLDRVVREIEAEKMRSHSAIPYSYVINICRSLAKKSPRNSAIRRRLRAYDDLCAQSLALINRELHPRKKRKGWELVKGQKRVMGKSGGVALNKTSQ